MAWVVPVDRWRVLPLLECRRLAPVFYGGNTEQKEDRLEITHIQKEKVPINESPYFKTFMLIVNAEHALETAKLDLLRGDSPYVSLNRVVNFADEAKTEWHTQQSKED